MRSAGPRAGGWGWGLSVLNRNGFQQGAEAHVGISMVVMHQRPPARQLCRIRAPPPLSPPKPMGSAVQANQTL